MGLIQRLKKLWKGRSSLSGAFFFRGEFQVWRGQRPEKVVKKCHFLPGYRGGGPPGRRVRPDQDLPSPYYKFCTSSSLAQDSSFSRHINTSRHNNMSRHINMSSAVSDSAFLVGGCGVGVRITATWYFKARMLQRAGCPLCPLCPLCSLCPLCPLCPLCSFSKLFYAFCLLLNIEVSMRVIGTKNPDLGPTRGSDRIQEWVSSNG